MYLCNEGEWGLRRSTPCMEVCIIIRRLLFLRQNRPKKIFNWLWNVKNLSEGCSTLEFAELLGCNHRTIKHLLQIVNRVARNVLRTTQAERLPCMKETLAPEQHLKTGLQFTADHLDKDKNLLEENSVVRWFKYWVVWLQWAAMCLEVRRWGL